MKKFFYTKIVLAVLFAICLFDIIIITTKQTKIKNIEKEAMQTIDGVTEIYTLNADCNGEAWFLIIPSLSIKAPIKEGVGQEILKYYIRTF